MIKAKYRKLCIIIFVFMYLCFTSKITFQIYDGTHYNVLPEKNEHILTNDNGNPDAFLNSIDKKTLFIVDNPHSKKSYVLDIVIIQVFSVIMSLGLITDLRKKIIEQNTIKFNGSKYKDGLIFP